MSGEGISAFRLWHLFSMEEATKKMRTFLNGGLWCAELNSIPTFPGDVEGTRPYGIFVSCWHKSDNDPSLKAWEVLGASGNGVALRAEPSSMQPIIMQFNIHGLRARFGQVRYLRKGQRVIDAAFEVAHSHIHEEEMRIAIELPDSLDPDTLVRQDQMRKIVPEICSSLEAKSDFRSVTFVECGGEDAIIIPISPADFIQEIVIGSKVSPNERNKFMESLEQAGLASKVRGYEGTQGDAKTE